MSDILEISRTGRVLTLYLNRPEKRNALNAQLCRSVVRALENADADPGVGAIVLAANGPAFCAGMDVSEIGSDNTEEINLAHEQLFTAGARLVTPLIGAVGERRAFEMALSGRTFGAHEAREIGLIHEVTHDPAGRAHAIAEVIAGSSPTSIRAGMSFVQEVRGRSWKEAGEIARRIRDEVFQSADFREGIRAFREKRKAEWPSLK